MEHHFHVMWSTQKQTLAGPGHLGGQSRICSQTPAPAARGEASYKSYPENGKGLALVRKYAEGKTYLRDDHNRWNVSQRVKDLPGNVSLKVTLNNMLAIVATSRSDLSTCRAAYNSITIRNQKSTHSAYQQYR